MKKNKTLSSVLSFSGIWLGIIALFMCFGAGIKLTGDEEALSGMSGLSIRLFDYVFHTGTAKSFGEMLEISPKFQAMWIVGFAMLLIAIISMITIFVMNLRNAGSKKAIKSLSIIAIVGMLVYGILFLLTKQWVMGAWTKEIKSEIEKSGAVIKLGAGAICAGIFSILGAGSILGSVLTNPEK